MAEPPTRTKEPDYERQIGRDSTPKTDTTEELYNTHNKRHEIGKGFFYPTIGFGADVGLLTEQAISLD